jgi:hypothetical protein
MSNNSKNGDFKFELIYILLAIMNEKGPRFLVDKKLNI